MTTWYVLCGIASQPASQQASQPASQPGGSRTVCASYKFDLRVPKKYSYMRGRWYGCGAMLSSYAYSHFHYGITRMGTKCARHLYHIALFSGLAFDEGGS